MQGTRRALIWGGDGVAMERIAPILERTQLAVDHAREAATAVQLIWSLVFDLVIVDHPLPDMDLTNLLATARDTNSPCRRCGLLLVAEPDVLEEAKSHLGRGVSRVVGRDDPGGEILCAVADLLDVAPRADVRAMVQLDAKIRNGPSLTLARTENLSLSGMLVAGGTELDVGTPVGFELHLPGESGAVTGDARVVRQTDAAWERVDGIGLRIERVAGSGNGLLAAFLERQLIKRD